MTAHSHSQTYPTTPAVPRALSAIWRQVSAFASVILNSRQYVKDGARVRALCEEARIVEATDPERAAALRHCAANLF